MHPDLHASGAMVVSRMRREIDIWRFPVRGTGHDPGAAPMQVTSQTGHVHTPTASPDGTQLAFLSDSGGHSNLWVRDVESGAERQITHERDPGVAMGVPIWSPDGKSIAFVSSRGNPGLVFGIWLVNPDGGSLRNLVRRGLGATWSPDGRWVYFVERANDVVRKVSVDGGSPVVVRSEPARNVIGIHGSTLYFLVERALVDGSPEFEIRAAHPEDGPSRVVTRIPATRLATWQVVNPALSPDGKWLAQALTDGQTTNVWIAATSSGEWQQITDFGDRATFIARRVCWSPDGRYVFAAVGEGDADIIRLER
jgi:Tol biopolymer transport system component